MIITSYLFSIRHILSVLGVTPNKEAMSIHFKPVARCLKTSSKLTKKIALDVDIICKFVNKIA